MRGEFLRRSGAETLERFCIPTHGTLGCALLDEFLFLGRIGGGFFLGALVFDHVLGSLHDDIALRVVTGPAGATRDLAEIPHAENGRLLAVVFPELRKDDGADRYVDAHAERIGAADEFEQAFLGELLHENAVLGQQARVVHADAVAQPAFHFLAVRTVELYPFEFRGEHGLFLLRADGEAHQRLRRLRSGTLRKMHEVDRSAIIGQQLRHAFGQRRLRILEGERHRPAIAAYRETGCAGQAGQLAFEKLRRAEGRRHQQESRLGQREQRHLPGVAALLVRVVMKLVHDHRADFRAVAAGERDVGENFRGAAEDGRLGVHGGIAGHHADIFRTEVAAQAEKLFVYQRLDRAGVDRALTGAQGFEVQRGGDEGFAGAGRRIQHHIAAGEQFENGFLLLGVKRQAFGRHRGEEGIQHGIGIG